MSSVIYLSDKDSTEPSKSQESELWELVKDSEFAQPFLLDGLDYSLLTIGEWKLLGRLADEHDQLVEERARELRFYPEYGLTDRERFSTLECMTYEELRPMYQYKAIQEKAERMMKELSFKEKVDVRIFQNITIHFSEFGRRFKKLDDEAVFVWSERYYRIMKKHGFLSFEESYSFISEEHKKRVLDAGLKLDPEDYLTAEELEETEGRGVNETILSH